MNSQNLSLMILVKRSSIEKNVCKTISNQLQQVFLSAITKLAKMKVMYFSTSKDIENALNDAFLNKVNQLVGRVNDTAEICPQNAFVSFLIKR